MFVNLKGYQASLMYFTVYIIMSMYVFTVLLSLNEGSYNRVELFIEAK